MDMTPASTAIAIPKKTSFAITFRCIDDQDYEFLCSVYESTRWDEMAATGWPPGQIRQFLRSQFHLQHTQYFQNYEHAAFDIILINGIQAGRLYVDRKKDDIRIVDIALLPEFRRQGIGAATLGGLIEEADRKGLQLSLHVEQNNPVLPWYERLGFRKAEMNGIYFFMKRAPAVKNSKLRRRRKP